MTADPTQSIGLAARISEAIRQELKMSSRGLPFRVWDISREQGLLHMSLEPEGKRSILDESLEEGQMAWEEEDTGSAEVISVLPAASIVNAYLKSGRPPKEGSLVYINPPQYLRALLALWEQDALAASFVNWFYELNKNRVIWDKAVPCGQFPTLRPAQHESFGLIRWRTSFLWGPPGTGKTYTLGRLLASYLVHHPADRVLLLSSTNVAVDLAILAVDESLNELKPVPRPVCYRFGSRFDPNKFHDKKHLTPLRDKTLVDRLRHHYEAVPDPADAEGYRHWKKIRDRLREAIRQENLDFLSRARLVAMTATLAAHDFLSVGSFDLVVFDEASQIGKAQAMTFAHLGSRVLFAGDPRQLAPIAQASTPEVTNWLAASPFDWMTRAALKPAASMLDEQWRMAKPISDAVSTSFYESKLKVAAPAETNPAWNRSRTAQPTKLLGTDNLVLVRTEVAAAPAKKYRGYRCARSARLVAALVVDHVLHWSIEDIKDQILVLTPYRAQRRLLEDELRSIQAPVAIASTVHRAQGSERQVVIFDPVCPTADFVSGAEGMRLVNVAMSRAKCRLIVLLQDGWEKHPVLRPLAERHSPILLNEDHVEMLLLSTVAPANVQRPASQALPLHKQLGHH